MVTLCCINNHNAILKEKSTMAAETSIKMYIWEYFMDFSAFTWLFRPYKFQEDSPYTKNQVPSCNITVLFQI